MKWLVLTACVWLVAGAAARGQGFVITREGRVDGQVRLLGEHLLIGETTVKMTDVVMLHRAWVKPPELSVTTRRGERWALTALTFEAGRFDLAGPVIGKRQVAADRIADVRFTPAATPPDANGVLARREGEPVPGQLMWIDAAEVAVDSPLGVLRLPRNSALVYRLAEVDPPKGDEHEVRFVDGTTLRGKLAFTGDGIMLDHALFGELKIKRAWVAVILRSTPGIRRVSELKPDVGARRSPLGIEQAGGLEQVDDPRAIDAFRIKPRTTVTFELPESMGRAKLSGAAIAEAGTIRLIIKLDGVTAIDRALPADEPITISEVLPRGRKLSVTVDHGERLVMPSAARLLDLCLTAVER